MKARSGKGKKPEPGLRRLVENDGWAGSGDDLNVTFQAFP